MKKESINLLIDRGNSFCKVATAKNGVISPIAIYPHLTQEVLECYFRNKDRSVSAIYSQVGESSEHSIHFLEKHTSTFVRLNSQTPVPLTDILYDREKLGSDRLALVVGASYLYPQKAMLIIDIGTAITYDLINADAVLYGGDITAGPRTRSKSLCEGTAQLPDVDFMTASVEDSFSTYTEQAIANGITRGIIAEVESYIIRAQQLFPGCETIITGGYGPYFANRIKYKTFAVPNLLMVGLNRILEYNESH